MSLRPRGLTKGVSQLMEAQSRLAADRLKSAKLLKMPPRKGALSREDMQSKTRDLLMHLCTSLGKYKMIMDPTRSRVYAMVRVRQKILPSIEWIETRIARVTGETRRIQGCSARVKEFHAKKILVRSLDEIFLNAKWSLQPEHVPIVSALRSDLRRVPIMDPHTATRWLVRSIDQALKINAERRSDMRVIMQEGLLVEKPVVPARSRPAYLDQVLNYAATLVLEGAVLNADLEVGNTGRFAFIQTNETINKIRGFLMATGNLGRRQSAQNKKELLDTVRGIEERLRGNTLHWNYGD